jgi:hypothetical protein
MARAFPQAARTADLVEASTARASALHCRGRCRERDPMASTGCSAGDAYPSGDAAPDVSELTALDRSPPDSGYVGRECSVGHCS